VARIRDTAQILIDIYQVKGQRHIHPIKVWDRYSPQMFLPHLVSGEFFLPLHQSQDAAALLSAAHENPLAVLSNPIAPWEGVYQKLMQHLGTQDQFDESNPEIAVLKQEFCRMQFGNHPHIIPLIERFFTIPDLLNIRNRLIGSGRIGGKAAGLLLARKILQTASPEEGLDLDLALENHDSFYIGSDVFYSFLVNNDLFRLRLELTRNVEITQEEFKEVERRFLEGEFSPGVMDQFRALLDYYGQAPIIVRSSSFLEDSLGNAFAGKYLSLFRANQSNPEERLESFIHAVKLVYASALNPDALSYRIKRGLTESDEQMAILVQRVSGRSSRKYFFPKLAGVAFSRNLYVWNNQIDPQKGMIRLVLGLGTRAVERVGGDYPRMVAISHPQLRPEGGSKIFQYSQRQVDVVDLANNELRSLPVTELLDGEEDPDLHLWVSFLQGSEMIDPSSPFIEAPVSQWTLTFNNLIKQTNFVEMMDRILIRLEHGYGHPVEIEFTASIDERKKITINVLQCRPLFFPGTAHAVKIPSALPADRVLFRARRMICGGDVSRIRYLLYIHPREYHAISSLELKKGLGRLVGKINRYPAVRHSRLLMMGPGRWGSSHIDLGINVGYADIDNASVLVELAMEEAGHRPEVSYGTHFFQDLVEGQTIYLPVYPEDPESSFNEDFFRQAPNVLAQLLPGHTELEKAVRLIDVPSATQGLYARVIADVQTQTAVCFLAEDEK
jgi:pyruvate, water dikinase